MKLTIIPEDGAVYIDGSATLGLAITAPLGVHALQWSGASGWVEHSTGEPNQQITDLPTWALDAVELRSSHLADLAAEADAADAAAAAAAAQAAYDAAHPTRASRVAAIKTERDRRKFNGVFVFGKWIHTDTYSRTQWMGMVMMGAGIPAIEWTTMDNTSITTSQALAGAVFQATATMDATLFGHAKGLVEAVNASDDPSSIDITTGWPATFEGA